MKKKFRIIKKDNYYWIESYNWFHGWSLYTCNCYSDVESAERRVNEIINGYEVIKTFK